MTNNINLCVETDYQPKTFFLSSISIFLCTSELTIYCTKKKLHFKCSWSVIFYGDLFFLHADFLPRYFAVFFSRTTFFHAFFSKISYHFRGYLGKKVFRDRLAAVVFGCGNLSIFFIQLRCLYKISLSFILHSIQW